MSISEEELERLLNREASALNRELEVERILKAFKLKYVLLNIFASKMLILVVLG